MSPPRQVNCGEGVLMVGLGGVFPAVIVTVATLWALKESDTRTETVRAPAVPYV